MDFHHDFVLWINKENLKYLSLKVLKNHVHMNKVASGPLLGHRYFD